MSITIPCFTAGNSRERDREGVQMYTGMWRLARVWGAVGTGLMEPRLCSPEVCD